MEQNSEVYSVKVLNSGKWKTISIDDEVPVSNNKPAFSYSKNGDLWVSLIEKAWAINHGSYAHIEKGIFEEALHDFTGAPIKHFFIQSQSFKK